jgi:hypothetical protein
MCIEYMRQEYYSTQYTVHYTVYCAILSFEKDFHLSFICKGLFASL